jgi:methylenetetrahydrofolate reductase (NADPH)
MANERTQLQERIEAGTQILAARVCPPTSADPGPVRAAAAQYAGKVHALGVSDNRDGVCMSALAAASLIVCEGVEPILHVVTRDRNRIALVSDGLGAQALGIRNLLCTTGTHQTLGAAGAAKNVFDLDSIHLLQTYAGLETDGSVVGLTGVEGAGPFCLGAAAAVYADPMEMQALRLVKKVSAGARYLITQPVFDLERFQAWWQHVTPLGIHERSAILAGIRLLADADKAMALAERRPRPMIPTSVLERLAAGTDKAAQREIGIEIAVETIRQLSELPGLRGFEIQGEGDDGAVLQVIEDSGLTIE